MSTRAAMLTLGFLFSCLLFAQSSSPNLRTISIEKNENFEGYDLLDISDQRLFVLAEHWHNIRSVPRATMKVLRYLHQEGNVRILAIEQGQSAAYMINQFLATEDTLMLRHIARNTMFWGQENYAFFQDLLAFNKTLSPNERISVQSIDIEYKMESAIFVINELMGDKGIPEKLNPSLGKFRQLFEETRTHREQFNGLAVMFYYDKELVKKLVSYTLGDLSNQSSAYQDFFGEDYPQFATMINDMCDGLIFDYTNPNTNYKFRDRLIYGKFTDLLEQNPDKGVLCVIGMRHATRGSSVSKLNVQGNSPIQGKVMNIRISALYNKSFMSSDLRRVNFNLPDQLKKQPATLMKYDPSDVALKSKQGFHYTLFINEDGNLTRFKNVYEGEF